MGRTGIKFLAAAAACIGAAAVSPAGAQSQAPGVTDTEVNVGAFGPLTGPV